MEEEVCFDVSSNNSVCNIRLYSHPRFDIYLYIEPVGKSTVSTVRQHAITSFFPKCIVNILQTVMYGAAIGFQEMHHSIRNPISEP